MRLPSPSLPAAVAADRDASACACNAACDARGHSVLSSRGIPDVFTCPASLSLSSLLHDRRRPGDRVRPGDLLTAFITGSVLRRVSLYIARDDFLFGTIDNNTYNIFTVQIIFRN